MEKRKLTEFAVASCKDDGGIYKYGLDEEGKATLISKIPMPSPMFFDISGDRLTALLRAPFEGSQESGIAVFNKLTGDKIAPPYSTLGVVGCHIALDGDELWCANYISGSVFKSPNKLVQHTGKSVNPERQSSPHVHSTFFTPDKKYVISCDLGTDEIYIYNRAFEEVHRARVPAGSGPRHIAFSSSGEHLYCINEMAASLSIFSYADGALEYIKDVDLKPRGYLGDGKGSAIKISSDGKRLYMTERGSETVVIAEVRGADVRVLSHTPCRGKEPRDLALLCGEKFLALTNQFSDTVSIYRILDDGTLLPTDLVSLPCPICIVEL